MKLNLNQKLQKIKVVAKMTKTKILERHKNTISIPTYRLTKNLLKIQKKVKIVLLNIGADHKSNWSSNKFAT